MTKLHKPIHRVTTQPLGPGFGLDAKRPLVVTIAPKTGPDYPERIELRPRGSRQLVSIPIEDLYHLALRSRANRKQLERARARKAKLAQRRR